MNKREIDKKSYKNIDRELSHFEKEGVITSSQKDNMLNQYEIKQKLNPMRLLLMMGLVLLTIGITTFVASSLFLIGDSVKLFIVIVGIILLHFIGIKSEKNHPKTSRILHYAGIAFLGAGILLIQDAFFIFSNDSTVYLIWGIGTLSYVFMLKDKNILIFSGILLFIFNSLSYFEGEFPYVLAIIIPILYLLSSKIEGSNISLYFTNILSLQFIAIVLEHFIGFDNADSTLIIALIMLFIGLGMVFVPLQKEIKPAFERLGYLLHGGIGFGLSFPALWELAGFGEYMHILFIALYAILIIILIRKGSLFAIFIASLLVLRFYFTFAIGLIPDSIAYVLSGFIFIAFGFYFEKKRKVKVGGKKSE